MNIDGRLRLPNIERIHQLISSDKTQHDYWLLKINEGTVYINDDDYY